MRFSTCLCGTFLLAMALIGSAPAGAAGPPLVADSWTNEVTATSARVNAEAAGNGLASTLRFEYLTEVAYKANLEAVPPRDPFDGAAKVPIGAAISIGSGTALQRYQLQLTGLAPGTSYRYRVLVTNVIGSTPGPTRSLSTEERVPSFALPDSRSWELVSPVDKNGGAVEGFGASFGGGVLQAAVDGRAATFTSSASFAGGQGSPGASQYLSRRGPTGWSTENITPPLLSGSYPSEADSGVPYQLFSTDLSLGLLSNGRRCRSDTASECVVANPPLPGSGAPAGYRNYYLRDGGDGSYRALLGAAAIGELALPPQRFEVSLAGGTPGLDQILLSSCAALTPDATEVPAPDGCDPAATNLYRWDGGVLKLVNLLPGDTQGTPGAALVAPAAISADGSRVYWRAAGNLYVREGTTTKWVDEAAGGGGSFQAASADGGVAFFVKSGHLWRFDAAAGVATDLTPGGEVQGVLGASADGSRIYYVSAAGLFLREGGAVTPIAPEVAPSSYPPATGTARVSADGTHLAFLSTASLTGYDNHGAQELYLYDSGGKSLTCVSCNPTGARALGSASIPGAIANGKAIQSYKPRVLSAAATRLFFDSEDALVPLDTNEESDVYEWEADGTGTCHDADGCIGLISSGRSEGGAHFVDASADGSDAFFITDGSLVPADPGSVDLYDARVGGGFPVPATPIPCVADACQPLPAEPDDPTPGTLFFGSERNPPLRFGNAKRKPKAPGKKHHRNEHRKHAGKGSR